MTPEQQRIAIAEACGWTCVSDWRAGGINGKHPTEPWIEVIPDYLSDLNAMHEAEESIPNGKEQVYFETLHDVSGNLTFYRATAAQRAQAFLRTIGKWKQD